MTLQGKGFFIWQVPECEGGDPAAIRSAAQAAGLSHVLVKIADGVKPFGVSSTGHDYTAPVVQALRAGSIAVWGWHYVYGNDPAKEAAVAIQRAGALGLDGYVLDAEIEYKQPGKVQAAAQFMTAVRAALSCPIALSSFRFPNYHPELPWGTFLEKCDLHMPQVYWEQAHNAAGQLRESKRQCDALPHAKPYIPTGPTYGVAGWAPSQAEISEFLQAARDLGLTAANFFQWEYCRAQLPKLWTTVSDFDWPAPSQVTPEAVTPVPEEGRQDESSGTSDQPGTTPVTPPGTTPIAPPDAFTGRFLAALNSRRASQAAALYDPTAVHVRGSKVSKGKTAIQGDYTALFTVVPLGTPFVLTFAELSSDARYLIWQAGSKTGQTTILLRGGKIVLDYTVLNK